MDLVDLALNSSIEWRNLDPELVGTFDEDWDENVKKLRCVKGDCSTGGCTRTHQLYRIQGDQISNLYEICMFTSDNVNF